jgi:Domain of unknown function (DUF5916)
LTPRLAVRLVLACGVLAPPLAAQMTSRGTRAPAPGASGKRAEAVRIEGPGIQLDGRLTEAAWQRAKFFSDFRQKEPVENAPPDERTEVAFLYDDDALYVGARLFSHHPEAIPRDVTRRDQYGNSEHIVVSFDPFLDRRTAYSFSVTSGGVRRDYYLPRDRDGFDVRDFTFDPVWEAKAHIDSTGWTAEMRIPFSQLRFNDRPVQEWGIQVYRWIPQLNEDIYWVVVPRNETGFASRFGLLEGLRNIHSGRRVEMVPYVASNGRFAGAPDPKNPFDPDGRQVGVRAGADLKMGLGPNITLDATINPDFGQVEADPAEVNLTAFETFFSERRPFFTEGQQLLRSTVDNYFYSRRVGGAPRGDATGDYVDRPDATTILGAAKVTGRLPSGLSIGALTALTDQAYARTYDSLPALTTRTMIAPRAGYGVLRLQQEFGREASTVGAIVSGVTRSFGDGAALRSQVADRAVAGGMDWVLRFKQGEYEITGDLGGSYVEGTTEAMTALQEAPARYLQRPDYRHRRVDSLATSLRGWRARLRWDKNAGNWLSGAEIAMQSPGFETNDMGRLQTADDIDANADINHRWTRPGRLFRNAVLGIYGRSNWNFDGVRTSSLVGIFSHHTWRNFFSSSLNLNLALPAQSDGLTRGGPLMRTPAGVEINAGVNSSYAESTTWSLSANVYQAGLGNWQRRLSAGLTLRPSSRVSLSFNPSYLTSLDHRQYLTTLDGGSAATYGQRYVFGAIRRTTLVAQLRLNYTFSPNLTMELYAEPFAASGRYSAIGELAQARTSDLRLYGQDGTTATPAGDGTLLVHDQRNGETFSVDVPDFRALSFRSNLVLRWEWSPGSTLFLVWQQSRAGFCTPSNPVGCAGSEPGALVGPGALRDALRATGDNFLAIKASYWIPF